jgi:hypothetical protein
VTATAVDRWGVGAHRVEARRRVASELSMRSPAVGRCSSTRCRAILWPDVAATDEVASDMEEDYVGFTMGTARGGGSMAQGQLLQQHLRCDVV